MSNMIYQVKNTIHVLVMVVVAVITSACFFFCYQGVGCISYDSNGWLIQARYKERWYSPVLWLLLLCYLMYCFYEGGFLKWLRFLKDKNRMPIELNMMESYRKEKISILSWLDMYFNLYWTPNLILP